MMSQSGERVVLGDSMGSGMGQLSLQQWEVAETEALGLDGC